MNKNSVTQLDAEYLSLFCYRIGVMQSAGVQIEDCISIVKEETKEDYYISILDSILSSLDKGHSFSLSLEGAHVFTSHMINMVKIGEVTGNLDIVLHELYVFYKNEAQTQNFIKKAVVYPLGMAILISVIFLVLISQVLPIFDQVSSQMGVELSPFAHILLGSSGVLRNIGYVIAGIIIIVSTVTLIMVNSTKGKEIICNKFVKLLIGKKLTLALCRSRFFSALSTMLSSGLNVEKAFEYASLLLKDTPYYENITQSMSMMENGNSLMECLKQSKLVDGIELGILSAGSRIGSIEESMVEVANRYQNLSDDLLESFLSKFELYLIAILCACIGAILVSVMLPLLGALTKLGA